MERHFWLLRFYLLDCFKFPICFQRHPNRTGTCARPDPQPDSTLGISETITCKVPWLESQEDEVSTNERDAAFADAGQNHLASQDEARPDAHSVQVPSTERLESSHFKTFYVRCIHLLAVLRLLSTF